MKQIIPALAYTAELVADIVTNPTKYGFVWTSRPLNRKGMNLGSLPHVEHIDLDLIEQTFGTVSVLAHMNGSSRNVVNQEIARSMKYDDRKTTDLQIKTAIVENWLGKKATRGVTVVTVEKRIKVYEAEDGTEFEDKTERDAYNATLAQ